MNQEQINQKGSLSLDNLLASQKQSSNKSGVGLEEGESLKGGHQITKGENSRFSSTKTIHNAFKQPFSARQAHLTRFNHSYFHGYCFACNFYGHKATSCRVSFRNNFSFANKNPFAPLRDYACLL